MSRRPHFTREPPLPPSPMSTVEAPPARVPNLPLPWDTPLYTMGAWLVSLGVGVVIDCGVRLVTGAHLYGPVVRPGTAAVLTIAAGLLGLVPAAVDRVLPQLPRPVRWALAMGLVAPLGYVAVWLASASAGASLRHGLRLAAGEALLLWGPLTLVVAGFLGFIVGTARRPGEIRVQTSLFGFIYASLWYFILGPLTTAGPGSSSPSLVSGLHLTDAEAMAGVPFGLLFGFALGHRLASAWEAKTRDEG